MSEEHPAHYNKGKIEVWDFISDQGMGFLEGNIIKYICRYRFKGTAMRDLLKAKNYLDRLIMERACFEAEVDAKAAEFKRQFEASAPPPESKGQIGRCPDCGVMIAGSFMRCAPCHEKFLDRVSGRKPTMEAGELVVKDEHGNLVPWVPSQGETEIPLTLEVFFGEKPEGTL